MSNDKQEKSLLDQARELATNYNKRATGFSERIKVFQSWLQRLEFRVRVTVEFDVPPYQCRLHFLERNGSWVLYVSQLSAEAWQSVGGLESCSVEIKVAAALAFPELLEKLVAAQREALANIDAAHMVLDDMAEKIGSFEEEGE